MPVGPFSVSVVDVTAEALVTIAGELDAATCEELLSCLGPVLRDSAGDIVVDLSGVVFADSTAIHLLTRVSLELSAGGRRLVVADPSPPVARVLSHAGLSDWFTTSTSCPEQRRRGTARGAQGREAGPRR